MGEAKSRGNYEERVAAAKARVEAAKPESLTCAKCSTELTEIQTMDSRGLKGIEAAFSACCTVCGHDTWSLKGDPESIAIIMEFLRQESGESLLVGHFGPDGWKGPDNAA